MPCAMSLVAAPGCSAPRMAINQSLSSIEAFDVRKCQQRATHVDTSKQEVPGATGPGKIVASMGPPSSPKPQGFFLH